MFYLLCEPKEDVKTVDKTLYDAKLKEIDKAWYLIDSLAIQNNHLGKVNDSLENRKPEYVYIHKNRNNEIELFDSSDLRVELQREISGFIPRQ
jgi:hypothetical protein